MRTVGKSLRARPYHSDDIRHLPSCVERLQVSRADLADRCSCCDSSWSCLFGGSVFVGGGGGGGRRRRRRRGGEWVAVGVDGLLLLFCRGGCVFCFLVLCCCCCFAGEGVCFVF